MNLFIDPDWKKQASMTATNDLDIEKAFSDQASGFVENKVGDLMKDEYRIGFEIVKKNDDNTRMVGVFAFKVDKDLIFAPVFFINGEIKGPLLYRAESKMFVPADKEWATYLIDSMERRDGKSRPKTALSESAPLVQMQRLTFNPSTGMGKTASGDVVEENKIEFQVKKVSDVTDKIPGVYVIEKSLDTKPGEQPKLSNGESILKMASTDSGTIELSIDGEFVGLLTKKAANDIEQGFDTDACGVNITSEFGSVVKKAFFDNVPDNSAQWEAMLDTVEKNASDSIGLTREFLKEPDFGKPAAELITKAASDYKFAEALASIYKTPEDLFPESYSSINKSASAESGLEICYSPDVLEKSASVSKKYFADGFYIKDTRPETTMSVVYEESPGTVAPPTTPGVYSILTQEGKFIDDVFVAPYAKDRAIGNDDNGPKLVKSLSSYGDYDRSLPDMIAIKNGEIYKSSNMFGILTGEAKDSSALSDSLEAKNAYMVFTGDNVIGPIAVYDTKSVDGVTRATIVQDSFYSNASGMYKDCSKANIIINKDLDESDIASGVFGKDAKFIKLKSKADNPGGGRASTSWEDAYKLAFTKLEGIGSTSSLDNWIFSTFNAKKVKVEKDVFEEKKAYVFSDDTFTSSPMNRLESLVKLARDMGIGSDKAYDILDKVDNENSCEFFVQPIEKSASRLTLIDRPIFDEDFDSEFGIPMQPTKSYKLRVQGDQNMEPASSIGDMMNPTTATGLPDLTVATTAPEDLRQLADTYHLPHVFEHGMIGTLAETFNAMALVDKYIPKLEEGVDALGRTKFLLHWCPDDFEKAYGKDDMANLEAEVDTNFEELGALLLKLLKKAEKNKKAEVKFESQ